MSVIDGATIQGFIDAGMNGATTADQGRALEDLICYVFGLVPSITITHRNAMNVFGTEEIDVALFNQGIVSLPNVILVEAKNWSGRVSSEEVNWFLSKLESRGLEFGILVTTRGITGDAQDLTAAHAIVSRELSKKRRLIVITTNELSTMIHTDELVRLIKMKLCDLAVRGTIA